MLTSATGWAEPGQGARCLPAAPTLRLRGLLLLLLSITSSSIVFWILCISLSTPHLCLYLNATPGGEFAAQCSDYPHRPSRQLHSAAMDKRPTNPAEQDGTLSGEWDAFARSEAQAPCQLTLGCGVDVLADGRTFQLQFW